MFSREKVLIGLIRAAGRPVHKTELTKWSFLLAKESATGGGASFYGFVPYHYGPFSFALYRDAEKLEAQGYLVAAGENAWSINKKLSASIEPPENVSNDLRDLIAKFRHTDMDKLIGYVYERYPEFTVNSKRKRLARRKEAQPAVYTAGYEGTCVDAFLNLLVSSGIGRLIDVRNNPVARRYGFHRSTLNRLLTALDISYVHLPSLGVKSEQRKELASQDRYEALFSMYERSTLVNELESVQTAAAYIEAGPSVLVCMERNPVMCHRSRLANRISTMTGLPIVHLQA